MVDFVATNFYEIIKIFVVITQKLARYVMYGAKSWYE